MIAAWMLVSIMLGGVIVLGALALEGVCRVARTSVRWTWAGALALLVLLTALVPTRSRSDSGAVDVAASMATVVAGGNHAAPASPLLHMLHRVRDALAVPATRLARAVVHVVPPAADRWLLAGWGACTIALLALLLLVIQRLIRAQREWPVASMQGERVRLAPDAGPAVLGLVRGTIVVPRWLFECPADVQQVVVAHEREHVRAGDPVLVTLGALCVVLLPWNPAVWWMLGRMRLAVELDCDRRVLAAGVRTRDYGELLIDLAGRMARPPIGAPLAGCTMLAERTTHLERRIVAMSAPRPRHVALRIVTGSFVALAAVLAACEARMPTSVDVNNMTAASAERAAVSAHMLSANDTLRRYYIDRVPVGASDAAALKPGQIATITVRRDTADSSKGSVWITTRAGADSAATVAARDGRAGKSYRVTIRPGTSNAKVMRITENGTPVADAPAAVHLSSSRFAGLVFIDGKRSEIDAMKQLAPADIQSIRVIKGASATALYPNDPAAAQGVIQITTKRAARS